MPKQTEKKPLQGKFSFNQNASVVIHFTAKRIPLVVFKIESTAFSENPQTIPLIFKKVEPKTFSENLDLPWRWEMI